MKEKHAILIINTCGQGLEFVLDNKYKCIAVEKQSVSLPQEAKKFLLENKISWSDLFAIGVVTGPGSFTGIRLGIAYAKGLALGLGIPIVPVNAFEIYLQAKPKAFVALASGRGDFFVAAADLPPCVMTADEVKTKQKKYSQKLGKKPFDLRNALPVVQKKLKPRKMETVIPLYLRKSYAEENSKCIKN